MPRAKEIKSGDKFGRLTFVRWVNDGYPRRAIYRCECGNEKSIIATNVTRGITKSCGCIKRKTTVKKGDVYGKWIVLKTGFTTEWGDKTVSASLCMCSCSKHTKRIISNPNLITGKSKSCGCKIRDTLKTKHFERNPRLCYGYRYIYKPEHHEALKRGGNKGFVMEHRYVMEKHIGRHLAPNECVHHKDHNRLNNNISNLQLLTISEHAKLHAMERCSAICLFA